MEFNTMQLKGMLYKLVGLFYDLSVGFNAPKATTDEVDKPRLSATKLIAWLILLAGIVVVFGFNPDLIEPTVVKVFNVSRMEYFKSWELGALVWNALFAIWFYMKVDPLFQRGAGGRRREWVVDKLTPIVTLIGVGGCTSLALVTLMKDERDAIAHVWYVLIIGVLFLMIDGVHALLQKNRRDKREFAQCFLLADLPTVPALVVLAYYELINQTNPKLEVFLSGAISFQLLVSTLMFACIQARVFDKLFEGIVRPEGVITGNR
jgi:hypothetical protein